MNLAFVRWCCSVGSPGCSGDRFYGPGGATKRGRRQEPRTTATPPSPLRRQLLAIRRVPAAVLLRFAIRKGKQQKPLPREASLQQTTSTSSVMSNPWPQRSSSCAKWRSSNKRSASLPPYARWPKISLRAFFLVSRLHVGPVSVESRRWDRYSAEGLALPFPNTSR